MTRRIKTLVIALLLGLAVAASVSYPVATTAEACCVCPGPGC